MRVLILSLFLMLFQIESASSCEVCGCSTGNYFIGPTPQFSKQFVGLRYSYRGYKTVLADNSEEFSNDQYQTAEIWAGYKLNRNLQLLAFVPYNINQSVSDDGSTHIAGLGDVSLLASYKIWERESLGKDTQSIGQKLWLGGGMKLATGKFGFDAAEMLASANSSPGTGAYDYLINCNYLLNIDNIGITSNLNYKINGTAAGFKFGNRLSASVFTYRAINMKNSVFSPNIGLLCEQFNANKFNKMEVENSKGYAVLGSMGLETKFDKISMGLNAQLPILSDISGQQTKITFRSMAHLSYAF